MTRHLVIGASGLIGEHLTKMLKDTGENLLTTYHTHPIPLAEKLDVSQPNQVRILLKAWKPNIIFLPAALTNVDYCENHRDEAYNTNVNGVRNIVTISNLIGARLIYFSTDYIFDGTAGPYDEEAVANPQNVYGQQKLIAEHYIASRAFKYLIIRTTIVYGRETQEKNFVYRLINSLTKGVAVKVPYDQAGTPTYAPDLAKHAIKLARLNLNDVINIVGPNWISRLDFAREISKVFNLPKQLIISTKTQELNQLAERPLIAGLKNKKAQLLLHTNFTSISEGLKLMQSQVIQSFQSSIESKALD